MSSVFLFPLNRKPKQWIQPQRRQRPALLPSGEASQVHVQRIGAGCAWREARWQVRQPNEPPQPRPVGLQPHSVAPEPLPLAHQPRLLHLQPRPLHPASARLLCPERAQPRLLLRPPGLASPVLSGPSGPKDLGQQQHAPRRPPRERVGGCSSRAHRQPPVLPARHGQSLWVLCRHHVTGQCLWDSSSTNPLAPPSLPPSPLTDCGSNYPSDVETKEHGRHERSRGKSSRTLRRNKPPLYGRDVYSLWNVGGIQRSATRTLWGVCTSLLFFCETFKLAGPGSQSPRLRPETPQTGLRKFSPGPRARTRGSSLPVLMKRGTSHQTSGPRFLFPLAHLNSAWSVYSPLEFFVKGNPVAAVSVTGLCVAWLSQLL